MQFDIPDVDALNRRAPVQGEGRLSRPQKDHKPAGTIAWAEHLEAWEAYAKRYGRGQTAERLAERGGFGWYELQKLLGHDPTTWEPLAKP